MIGLAKKMTASIIVIADLKKQWVQATCCAGNVSSGQSVILSALPIGNTQKNCRSRIESYSLLASAFLVS
ncbi:hypothetical protein CH76_12315 [Lysinibacillus sp. BF-4]|nr:hypothetical protein CH76_12315 [Lysinibacillus sp. BF-4]